MHPAELQPNRESEAPPWAHADPQTGEGPVADSNVRPDTPRWADNVSHSLHLCAGRTPVFPTAWPFLGRDLAACAGKYAKGSAKTYGDVRTHLAGSNAGQETGVDRSANDHNVACDAGLGTRPVVLGAW